jgi:glutamate-5-semialdehyde dehydrogenase
MASSPDTSPAETPELLVARLAQAGRAAQRILARLSDTQKAAGLRAAAEAMRASETTILAANALDG